MRISDWSSDVCSSDLERWAREGIDEIGTAHASMGVGGGRSRAFRDARHRYRPRPRLRADPRASRFDPARIGAATEHPLHPDRRHGICRPVADRQQAGGDRSEEHTSELQSLMRISYAVFCLKKKNNTLKKQPNNTSQLNHTIKNT